MSTAEIREISKPADQRHIASDNSCHVDLKLLNCAAGNVDSHSCLYKTGTSAESHLPPLTIDGQSNQQQHGEQSKQDQTRDNQPKQDQKKDDQKKNDQPKNESVMNKVGHFFGSAAHQAELFGEGTLDGAIYNPVNGVTELINHTCGTNIGKLQLDNQQEVDNSIAGQIGKFTGMTADAIALGLATGGVADAFALGTAGTMLTRSAAGVLMGGVLSPTGDKDFWKSRGLNAGLGALMPAVMGKADDAIGKVAGNFSEPIEKTLKEVGGLATTGGVVTGISDLKSIVIDHKPLPVKDALLNGGEGMARRAIGKPIMGLVKKPDK